MGNEATRFVRRVEQATSHAQVQEATWKYCFKKIAHKMPEVSRRERVEQKIIDTLERIPQDKRAAVNTALVEVTSRMEMVTAFKGLAVKECRRSAMARVSTL